MPAQSVYVKLEKILKSANSWRSEADKPAEPITVDDSKKLTGISVRKERDRSVTLISARLEINIKPR